MLNFSEALTLLKQGKRVYRQSTYSRFNFYKLVFPDPVEDVTVVDQPYFIVNSSQTPEKTSVFHMDTEHILANDWLYDEQMQ